MLDRSTFGREVLMIQFPVFGTTYVPERHYSVEANDRDSLIAECRVQEPSSAHEFELQARSGQARCAEAAATNS